MLLLSVLFIGRPAAIAFGKRYEMLAESPCLHTSATYVSNSLAESLESCPILHTCRVNGLGFTLVTQSTQVTLAQAFPCTVHHWSIGAHSHSH